MNMTTNNEMVRAAITLVGSALKNNKDFRLSWQTVMAQSILEENSRLLHPLGSDHAHIAANRFISKLVGEPLEVI